MLFRKWFFGFEPLASSLELGGRGSRVPAELKNGMPAVRKLVARGSWNVVDGDVRVSPGIHYRFPVAGQHFAAALNYDFYAVANVPHPANEWSVGLLFGRQLGRTLVLGASASYGLDTHDFRPVVQLTAPLHVGRN